MERLIIFFILIGIFNFISKMIEKKAKIAKYNRGDYPPKKKKPYFSMEDVDPQKKVYKHQSDLKIDDLFRSIDEAAGKIKPIKQQSFDLEPTPKFAPPPPPPVIDEEEEDLNDVMEEFGSVLEANTENISISDFKSGLVSSEAIDAKMVKPLFVGPERKNSITLEFSKNPVINGIIWAEVLKRPGCR